MADRDFNWTELLAVLGGAAAGGTAGFFLGGPAGAWAGGSAGASFGAQLSPGGFWEEEQQQLPGRAALGSDIQAAAQLEMGAIQRDVGRNLTQALRRSDIGMAQRGFLRSGEAESSRRELEMAASRDVASASARIQLESLGLATQAQTAQAQYDIQLAQLETQKRAAEGAMWTEMGKIGIMYLLNRQAPDGGGVDLEGETYTNPGLTETWSQYK